MNDCVKYISAINDKLNQVELLNQNQHVFAECAKLSVNQIIGISVTSFYF